LSTNVVLFVTYSGWTRTNILNLPRVLESSEYKTDIANANEILAANTPHFQEAEVVGLAIADCLFSTRNPAVMMVEKDNFMRVYYKIAGLLPHRVQDAMIFIMTKLGELRVTKKTQ